MLVDALIVLIYIALIIFIITLIVLCIKLIGTLGRIDYLVENITRKAESLDGVFELIENTTSKFGMIGSSITNYISGIIGKIFSRKKNKKRMKEREDIYE